MSPVSIPSVGAAGPGYATQINNSIQALDDEKLASEDGRWTGALFYNDIEDVPDAGADVFFIKRRLNPATSFHLVNTTVVISKGDNATFIGAAAVVGYAIDHPTVTAATKGVLYGLQSIVKPIVDRNNVPFDDVVGLSIENQGTAKGTDAAYFGRNRSDLGANPTANDWGVVISNDSWSTFFIRSTGTHSIGLDLTAATTTDAIALANNQKISQKTAAGVLSEIVKLDTTDNLVLYDKVRVLASGSLLLNNNASVAARDAANATNIPIVSLDSTDVLKLYGSALSVFSGGGTLLPNNKHHQGRNAANSANVNLIGLSVSDLISVANGKLLVSSTSGNVVIATNNAGLRGTDTGGASQEIIGLTSGDDVSLYTDRARLLNGGGLRLKPVTATPGTPGANGFVIYNDAGTLKAIGPSGTVTTLAVA